MKSKDMTATELAFIAGLRYEANSEVGVLFGEKRQEPWGPGNPFYASSIEEVKAEIDFEGNREQRRRASHEKWLADRIEAGWAWGPVRNNDKKENPALVPYDRRSAMDIMKGSAQDKALEMGIALVIQKRELERATTL